MIQTKRTNINQYRAQFQPAVCVQVQIHLVRETVRTLPENSHLIPSLPIPSDLTSKHTHAHTHTERERGEGKIGFEQQHGREFYAAARGPFTQHLIPKGAEG